MNRQHDFEYYPTDQINLNSITDENMKTTQIMTCDGDELETKPMRKSDKIIFDTSCSLK